MQKSDASPWLNTFPELQDIQDNVWLQSIAKIKSLRVARDNMLFRDGDRCSSYVLVTSGSIRVQKIDPQGREIVLYRVEEGQSCMLTTICLMGSQEYPAEGVAETDVEMVMLQLDDFEQVFAGSIGFRRFVMNSIGQRICDLMQLVEDVAFGRMDARLARLLLKRIRHQKSLDCTHQDLAFELGTAREVVSRLLKDFERKEWVSLSRGKIRLRKPQALTEVAEQER